MEPVAYSGEYATLLLVERCWCLCYIELRIRPLSTPYYNQITISEKKNRNENKYIYNVYK